jgi:hypothetical protein
MVSRKFILKQLLIVAIALAACVGAMYGVFALLGKFSTQVLLGGIVGYVLALGYFFFMSIGNARIAEGDSADATRGKAMAQGGMLLRYVAVFALLVVFVKTGLCEPFSMVIPLALLHPILLVYEFFRKGGA